MLLNFTCPKLNLSQIGKSNTGNSALYRQSLKSIMRGPNIDPDNLNFNPPSLEAWIKSLENY